MKVGVLVASLIFTLVVYATQPQLKKEISESEAIRLAEEFIVDNGYTDLPPSEDKSKLKCESVHCGLDEQSMKIYRHKSLLRQAYGVWRYDMKKRGKGSWTVVFRHNCDHPEYRRTVPDWEKMCKTQGRAVTMDLYGNNLHMMHQDCYLEFDGLRKIAP
ncbi:MAG TPA: hypothetical protein VJZ77_23240 [Blastocatellia bacterium]|nr:hypothetical protein [Blastocatellia bacterium]